MTQNQKDSAFSLYKIRSVGHDIYMKHPEKTLFFLFSRFIEFNKTSWVSTNISDGKSKKELR